MAIPLISFSGLVVVGDGTTLTGTIKAELSQPASIMDGAVSERVVGTVTGTIAAGVIETSFKLAPNALMTPAGTYWRVTISGIGDGVGYRSMPPEKWQLASTPATIDVGAVPRLGVIPGVAVGVLYPDIIIDGGAPSSVYGGTSPVDGGGV